MVIDEYGCSRECIRAWLNNYNEDKPFNYQRAIESDDEGDSIKKRTAIEEAYNQKNTEIAAKNVGISENLLIQWLNDYENKVSKLFGSGGKKNRNANEDE